MLAIGIQAQPVIWTVDPLVKVFRQDTPPADSSNTCRLTAAQGEYESAQICVRSGEQIRKLRLTLSALQSDAAVIPAEAVSWNPVGYVPLPKNTPNTPSEELCCVAPTEVPDPLLPPEPIDVEANATQPLWLTLHVPRDAVPGDYSGRVTVEWDSGQAEVAISLRVWPFAIPAERHLSYTNWINHGGLAKHHGVDMYSDEYFEILAKYARAAAEHHQNILWISLGVVGISERADGRLEFDWTTFDRWVEVVSTNGCGRLIEISPLGHWAKGWDSTEIALSGYTVKMPDGSTKQLSAEELLPQLLPALEQHLQERGWLERTVLHIADEPAVHHAASWREKSRWVHALAPGIRRIDAIEAPDFGDDLEIWVPKLNHLYNWLPHYERAREAGKELWFYTCCHPTGVFPNRFLDQPLIKTRILQWYNWRYRLSGYLHWGLNFWDDDPLHSSGSPNLPPGDCWIVYPGPEGPLSSLRWEALRDGFEDYEYLWLLADRIRSMAAELGAPPSMFDPNQRSDELACKLVRTMIDYTRDAAELRSVREEIAEDLIGLTRPPKGLVCTDPPLYHKLASGPIVVATYVWAEKGTEVRVNGSPAHQQPDGRWAHHTFLPNEHSQVKVEITKEGVTKTVVRQYG